MRTRGATKRDADEDNYEEQPSPSNSAESSATPVRRRAKGAARHEAGEDEHEDSPERNEDTEDTIHVWQPGQTKHDIKTELSNSAEPSGTPLKRRTRGAARRKAGEDEHEEQTKQTEDIEEAEDTTYVEQPRRTKQTEQSSASANSVTAFKRRTRGAARREAGEDEHQQQTEQSNSVRSPGPSLERQTGGATRRVARREAAGVNDQEQTEQTKQNERSEGTTYVEQPRHTKQASQTKQTKTPPTQEDDDDEEDNKSFVNTYMTVLDPIRPIEVRTTQLAVINAFSAAVRRKRYTEADAADTDSETEVMDGHLVKKWQAGRSVVDMNATDLGDEERAHINRMLDERGRTEEVGIACLTLLCKRRKLVITGTEVGRR
jgi:hypothetical protein